MKFKLLLRKLWCWPCRPDPYLLGCILLGQKHSYLGQVLGREVNLQTLRETLDVNNRRQPYFQRIPAALGATHSTRPRDAVWCLATSMQALRDFSMHSATLKFEVSAHLIASSSNKSHILFHRVHQLLCRFPTKARQTICLQP
jgi:hypothetical protein